MIKLFERARERRALEQEKSQRIAELTLRVRALEAENARLRRNQHASRIASALAPL